VVAVIEAQGHHLARRDRREQLDRAQLQAPVRLAPLPEHVALDANRLISDLLSPGRVDYAFVYRVHAADHKLPFTPLPKEINLGDPSLAGAYAAAEVPVTDFHGGTEMLKGTYIDALPQLVDPATGRVHTSFNQAVAAALGLSVRHKLSANSLGAVPRAVLGLRPWDRGTVLGGRS
jgi:hypothetical protein